ncbi:MAG: hypothetical protein VYE44_02235 [Verrucomicrobiota bacterium]|nr:hypothetical protein [Verrucomicrobiota bacterium]
MSLVFMEMVSVKWVGDVERAGVAGQADDFALGSSVSRSITLVVCSAALFLDVKAVMYIRLLTPRTG